MTGRGWAFLAAAGSTALLAGAFGFQLLGYAPCKMCLWQRWPHAVAIVIGLAMVMIPSRVLALFGGLAALVTAAIGMYHAGVEQKWWEGPSSCSGSGLTGLSGQDLLSTDAGPAIVMCDEIAWQLMGISMAGWNAVISLGLAFLWLHAARRLVAENSPTR